jgi:hypothetical protein
MSSIRKLFVLNIEPLFGIDGQTKRRYKRSSQRKNK